MKKLFACLITGMMILSLAACLAETEEGARIPAETYAFELAEGENQYFENLVFDGDVTVSGDNAQITFVNCAFGGDIINIAEVATRVLVIGSEINGKCVIRNTTKEATIETAFPKFLVDAPVEVVAEDCVGSVIPLGDFEVMFNGEACTMEDSEYFSDTTNPEAGIVPYEGQEANYFCIAQWWENGEKVLMIISEYDVEA